MCAIGYVTGESGGMSRASRMFGFSVTIANWVNVLARTSLMHLKTPLQSLKETSRSVSSKGRPWLERAGLVIGLEFNAVLLLAQLAVGAVEAVGFVVPAGVPLTVECVDADKDAGPVAAPFTIEAVEAVGGVGPVVTPLTVAAVEML